MRQFIILLKKDLLEFIKTKRLLIIGIIFITFALSSPILAKMTPELLKSIGNGIKIEIPDPTLNDSYLQFYKNISGVGLFALIIIFGSLIANERSKGLYTNLVNNGVKRSNFVLSKIVSQIIITTGIYLFSVLVFCAYNYILFDKVFETYSILSLLTFYIYLIFVICITNLFSAISKNNITSIVFSFITIFSLAIFDLFQFGKYLPNYLITISNMVISNTTYLDYTYINIMITILISMLSVIMTIKLCNNKE